MYFVRNLKWKQNFNRLHQYQLRVKQQKKITKALTDWLTDTKDRSSVTNFQSIHLRWHLTCFVYFFIYIVFSHSSVRRLSIYCSAYSYRWKWMNRPCLVPFDKCVGQRDICYKWQTQYYRIKFILLLYVRIVPENKGYFKLSWFCTYICTLVHISKELE